VDIAILISGLASGAIIFHTSIIAPTVFKTLGPPEAKVFLRTVFPKLFNKLVVLGLIMLFLYFFEMGNLYIALVTIILPFVCNLLIPATNRARDDGNNKVFSRLHTISVLLTLIVLLSNLSWLVYAYL
tara:strand:- start:4330 stop:4713 length:384 start_codon:yes stop_codon:yes gene_type:complete